MLLRTMLFNNTLSLYFVRGGNLFMADYRLLLRHGVFSRKPLQYLGHASLKGGCAVGSPLLLFIG